MQKQIEIRTLQDNKVQNNKNWIRPGLITFKLQFRLFQPKSVT